MATVTIVNVREGKEVDRSETPYIVDARTRAFRSVQRRDGLVAAVADCDGIFVVYYWNSQFQHVGVYAYRCAHEAN